MKTDVDVQSIQLLQRPVALLGSCWRPHRRCCTPRAAVRAAAIAASKELVTTVRPRVSGRGAGHGRGQGQRQASRAQQEGAAVGSSRPEPAGERVISGSAVAGWRTRGRGGPRSVPRRRGPAAADGRTPGPGDRGEPFPARRRAGRRRCHVEAPVFGQPAHDQGVPGRDCGRIVPHARFHPVACYTSGTDVVGLGSDLQLAAATGAEHLQGRHRSRPRQRRG